MSVYRDAIEQTTNAIDRRARYYRNLIVAVVGIGFGSIVWAVVSWELRPLLAYLLLFPLCGLYFFLDERLLQVWRSGLLELWCRNELDFLAFKPAIEAVPNLPPSSIQGMLSSLLLSKDLLAEQQLSSATRKALLVVVTLLYAVRLHLLALKILTLTIVLGSLVIAGLWGSWFPLLGVLVGFLLVGTFPLWKNRQINKEKKKLLAYQKEPEYDHANFQHMLETFSWELIPEKQKKILLQSPTK